MKTTVVGLAGASGSIYAARFLKALLEIPGKTYLIVSPTAIRIFREEYSCKVSSGEELLDFICERWKVEQIKNEILFRPFLDVGADIASGSNDWESMLVIPSSMKTLASISIGLTNNLIERCADVTLKERRPLVLVPREAPYNRIHLKNMLSLDEAGAIILPASPGFYQIPKSLDDLGDFIATRAFKLLGFDVSLYPKWEG
ncbi:MAG: UbiX family flavin prenyltransferase [Spirochaetota bacterium]